MWHGAALRASKAEWQAAAVQQARVDAIVSLTPDTVQQMRYLLQRPRPSISPSRRNECPSAVRKVDRRERVSGREVKCACGQGGGLAECDSTSSGGDGGDGHVHNDRRR